MIWILIPALVALVLKAYIGLSTHSKSWATPGWLAVVLTLACLNLAEVLIYFSVWLDRSPDFLLQSYYVACIAALVSCFSFIYQSESIVQKCINSLFIGAGCLLALGVMFSDLLVGGYVVGSFPIKAEKQSYYFLFQLFSFACVITTLSTVYLNYRRSKDIHRQIEYSYIMLGFIPIGFTILVLTALMALGFNANATMVIPLATTAFLFISSRGRVRQQIRYDLRRIFSPRSQQSLSANRIEAATTQLLLGESQYRDAITQIELELLNSVIEQHNGNITHAAKFLGVQRSYIYQKRKAASSKSQQPKEED